MAITIHNVYYTAMLRNAASLVQMAGVYDNHKETPLLGQYDAAQGLEQLNQIQTALQRSYSDFSKTSICEMCNVVSQLLSKANMMGSQHQELC